MLKRRNNIVFIEDAHLYYVDNILVPSVTTILSATIFKGKYSEVPPFVLERAAQFGSNVHRAIELHDIEGLNDKQLHCVIEYVKLIKHLNIKELAHETLLAYNYDYAGTADLLLEYEGKEILADIKTTSKLDLDYLSWQLSMYALGLDFTGDLYAIWLNKKGDAEFHQVERKSKEEIEELLRGYHNAVHST